MYARVRRIKEGQEVDAGGYRDTVIDVMEELSNTIQEFKPFSNGFIREWYNDIIHGYHWHKSWLSFKPKLTFRCPVCGEKIRIRINLKEVDDLNKVKLRNPIQCNCGFRPSFVDIKKRELLDVSGVYV